VILTVVKPVRITHLVVCLHAYVKVFKNTVTPGEAGPEIGFLGPGRGRRGGEYLGNGFATLFEDELVLCGEGRLKEGIYKFQFELELPPYNLPSSINVCSFPQLATTRLTVSRKFERGTISYILTSTLTRPTTIAPTVSCHRRITVLEDLDIAPFPAPKPRVVSLEPVSKKSKGRLKQKLPSNEQVSETNPNSARTSLGRQDSRPPLSPAPSDVSGSSLMSTSSQSFPVIGESTRTASVRSSEARSTSASLADKTITATAELQRAGALPGDTVPLKIIINHNRKVRSPHGIIITLFRQGRIDMHPAIPLGATSGDGKKVYEDAIPKSWTGLSGLSFGTSRASSVFRKDLSQTFAPLIVDPVTMTATVKTSVRIPEDAFPTITRVPGGMISFHYYVEVVTDLRGKLAAQDRFLPRLNMVSGGSNFSTSGQIFAPADQTGSSITSNWAGNILDTDQIRREKGVVAMMFEVVVGTRDSTRRARQVADENSPTAENLAESHPTGFDGVNESTNGHWEGGEDDYANGDYYPQDGYYDPEEPYWQEYPATEDQPFQSLGEVLQPPETQEPEDEKSRLRRAEEMLLPSRPPEEGEAGPSTAVSVPTAPAWSEDDDLFGYQDPLDGNEMMPSDLPSGPSVETIILGPSRPPAGQDQSHSDDKLELERQRLMMEASAPGPVARDTPHTGRAANVAPSAPVLDEEDQISNIDGGGDEALPRYQR
jgi:hypothetical protein